MKSFIQATAAYIAKMPAAGKLILGECFATAEEAMGTMTTTVGIASIEVAGVEVATVTVVPSDAIGVTYELTLNSTYATAANGAGEVRFAAADAIECITKTQAVDGTVTGTLRFYLSVELSD